MPYGWCKSSEANIVHLNWHQIAQDDGSGTGQSLISGIAALEEDDKESRLIQVLDLEVVLDKVRPQRNDQEISLDELGGSLDLAPDSLILAADDSYVARVFLE
ncbi:hypothetical protein ABS755_05065 [Castellaniella sp. FW104-16D08]|uniref:hypothetical protein n=1 Tax=unclassified Castellaniella TaxID=2617606 RepID=UPI003315CCB2